MDLEKFKKSLGELAGEYKIVPTLHAEFKIGFEQISLDDIIENIKNLELLKMYIKYDEFKYALYFVLSKTLAHKYVIEINNFEKIIKIITVVN